MVTSHPLVNSICLARLAPPAQSRHIVPRCAMPRLVCLLRTASTCHIIASLDPSPLCSLCPPHYRNLANFMTLNQCQETNLGPAKERKRSGALNASVLKVCFFWHILYAIITRRVMKANKTRCEMSQNLPSITLIHSLGKVG